jgi:hypothetical protein
MKNWTKLAEAMRPEIPTGDLDLVTPPLDALESAFRPLLAKLPYDVEPAVVFRAVEDVE